MTHVPVGPRLFAGVMTLLVILAVPAPAQQEDSLRRQLRLPLPPTLEVAARGGWIAPGITIAIPSGYGADYGDAFVGAGFQARTRYRNAPDGGVVVGFGLGNARELVGLELAFTSFGTVRSCCRGGISAKLHRVLPADASVAVGVENALVWGNLDFSEHAEATDAGTSTYAAVSKVFRLRSDPVTPFGSMTLTLGAGNGRFRTEDDILQGRESVGVFGGASLRVSEAAAAVASWTGQDLMAGVSVVPFRDVPLFITPALADLTTEPRFILGIGYGFNYASLF